MVLKMELKKYNQKWKVAFDREKARLEDMLREQRVASIEHIGATSVEGCSTLGTIDILLSVYDRLDFFTIKNILAAHGYQYIQGKSNDLDDLFFIRRNSKKQIIATIHLVHYASITYQEYILFKFYLLEGNNAFKYNERRERVLLSGAGANEYQKDKSEYIEYVLTNFCRTSEAKQ